jgi:hypothetical protein
MAGTKHGGDTPGSFLELLWRLLADQERRSALTELGTTAFRLVCGLLFCLGLIACGILFVLETAGAKRAGVPVLLPSGLALGASLIGVIIGITKTVKRRRLGALDDGSAPTARSLPPSRTRCRRERKGTRR